MPHQTSKLYTDDSLASTLSMAIDTAEPKIDEPQLDGLVESSEARSPPLADLAKPPLGSILTGKQEHYLKRELISHQTKFEISELSSPTALQRFGAPFRSDAGEVSPEDSELPLLRYIFVHHVRNFPFLDQAREKEFWQDKLQVFLESFATKHISSSEDRLEETKRRKLALKTEKLVELMMVSGIPTASGYEERIRFSEMEVVDRGANEQGLVVNLPEGSEINGWDVNIAGVRTVSVKRTVRHHAHAEFLIRVKERGKPERFVGRRYGDFVKMHKQLRIDTPGKVITPLPRKNKTHTAHVMGAKDDSDLESISSMSTQSTAVEDSGGLRSYLGLGPHRKNASSLSVGKSPSPGPSPSKSPSQSRHATPPSTPTPTVLLHREEQRVSLRAFLRNVLQNEQIAKSRALHIFLTRDPCVLTPEDNDDIAKRREMDLKRVEEQKRFYEVARKRAKELDVHMEKFRRDIVERNGLTKLFKEIRVKEQISDLSPEYQKFAEWLRIEVAATIYHIFLAEDNSPDVFAQAKRIHSLVPYTALKNVIRYANPAAVMKGVLDLFLAQPFGARSLMQRIFSLALSDGVRATQKSIDSLYDKIQEPALCDKIRIFTESNEELKADLRKEATNDEMDVIVVLLRSPQITPELQPETVGRIFNAFVAYNNAVDNVDQEMRQGAELFAHLKQLLKLYTRQRDKTMMMSIIEEPVTMQLFRDLFTIFYEPLVRVYKSANVYSSVTDFASFADDTIRVVDAAQRQDVSADPNQTVQAFIDLCERHQEDFYKFVHEVHIHDNGLFDQLMGWLEGILEFLRQGPKSGKLDINALFQGAVDMHSIDKDEAISEINQLIEWQMARKKWHQDKTRRKMAAQTDGDESAAAAANPRFNSSGGTVGFKSDDFGLNEMDIQDLGLGEGDDLDDEEGSLVAEMEDEEELEDPIAVERRRRSRVQEALKSKAGEPKKPEGLKEVEKLWTPFGGMLRGVLAT